MEVIQTLTDCVELCVRHGIQQVILCPGSRNAALIIAFEQNPKIQCFSISDERVAAFIGMGMAIETGRATAVVCTSGTAALNFAPAIAEAYFQEVPLLVLTADRPPEWIDQYDGQTVFQTYAYGKHVKSSYNLVPDYGNANVRWFANRTFNEAIIQCHTLPQGPVHINIPIREPFYPTESQKFLPATDLRFVEPTPIEESLNPAILESIISEIKTAKSVWIVVGQQHSKKLNTALNKVQHVTNILIISDILGNIRSNLTSVDNIFAIENELQKPDLLITCGKSVITKRLKLYLRKNKVTKHWHVQKTLTIRDPYQSITRQFSIDESAFFSQIVEKIESSDSSEMKSEQALITTDQQIQQKITEYLITAKYSDLKCVQHILACIPENSVLHLGNSMSVRYANAINFLLNKHVEVQCNRGTSGIEGSVSTAVGQAMITDRPVFCIVGDISFLYDKNALWHNYIPSNLKIIILNNGGGNIFRMIPGPKQQNSYAEFFETQQNYSAELIAAHYKINYLAVKSTSDLAGWEELLSSSETTIIECFTKADINERVYKELLSIR